MKANLICYKIYTEIKNINENGILYVPHKNEYFTWSDRCRIYRNRFVKTWALFSQSTGNMDNVSNTFDHYFDVLVRFYRLFLSQLALHFVNQIWKKNKLEMRNCFGQINEKPTSLMPQLIPIHDCHVQLQLWFDKSMISHNSKDHSI